MDLKNKIGRLPDCYDKRNTSNNWKILELARSAKEDIAKDLESIRSASDIESAEGAALDVFGRVYKVQRGRMSDAAYRMLILQARALKNLRADYESVYAMALSIFGCSPDELKISEAEEPFSYRIERFPMQAVKRAGMDIDQATKLLGELVPLTGRFVSKIYDADETHAAFFAGAILGADKVVILGTARRGGA